MWLFRQNILSFLDKLLIGFFVISIFSLLQLRAETCEAFASAPSPFTSLSSLGTASKLPKQGLPNDMVIEANQIFYEGDAVIANGKVQMQYKHYYLSCDKIVLRQNEKQIIATGSVYLYDQKEKNHYYGEVADINYANLQGLILKVKTEIYKEKVHINANVIRKFNDKLLVGNNITATTCEYCERDNLPLWQINAEVVKVDLAKERIEYNHVDLKLLDYTIFRFPILFSPTPNASAKSGLMLPNIRLNSNTGLLVNIPYYLRLADNIDITFTAGVSSSRPLVGDIKFEHLLQNGGYKLRFNITNNNLPDIDLGIKEKNLYSKTQKTREFRTYYSGKGNFTLRENAELGFQLEWLNDKTKTYLKKYNIDDDDILVSRLYFNAQEKNWYATPEIIKTEDLRDIFSPGNALAFRTNAYSRKVLNKNTTLITYASANSVKARFESLSYLNLDFGLNNRRVSEYGVVSNLYLGIKASGTNYDEEVYNKTTATLAPQLILDLNWPLKWKQWLIQPMLLTSITSKQSRSGKLISRLHEPNLYRLNHSVIRATFNGANRNNALYGFKFQKAVMSDELFTTFIGGEHQDGRIYANGSNDNCIMFNSLTYNSSYFDHKIWLDSKEFKIIHDEINLTRAWKKTELALDYTFLDYQYYKTDLPKPMNYKFTTYNHEVGANVWYNLYQKWWINLSSRSKIGKGRLNDLLIAQGAGMRYKHDCLQVDFGLNYNFLKLKDLRPSMTYYMSIVIPGLN